MEGALEIPCFICASPKSSIHYDLSDLGLDFLETESEKQARKNQVSLKRAFSIFCKTLKLDPRKNGRRRETLYNFILSGEADDSKPGNEPCCTECFSVFKALVEQEEILQKALATQQNLAKDLKAKLFQSFNDGLILSDGIWSKIRSQLICCLQDVSSINDVDESFEFSPASSIQNENVDDDFGSGKILKISDIANNITEGSNNDSFLHSNGTETEIKVKPKSIKPTPRRYALKRLQDKLKREGKEEKSKSSQNPSFSFSNFPSVKPCSISLQRLTPDEMNLHNVINSTPKVNTSTPSKEPAAVSSSPSGRGTRKSKLKAYEFIQKSLSNHTEEDGDDIPITDILEEEIQIEDISELGVPDNDDFFFIDENDDDSPDGDDNSDEDFENDSNSLAETKRRPKRRKTSPLKLSSFDLDEQRTNDTNEDGGKPIFRNKTNGIFYLIHENILLCRSTLVSLSSKSLKCREPDCSFSFEGNDFTAFENILNHVTDIHEIEYSTHSKVRICPICEKDFTNAPEYRHHLLHVHDGIRHCFCEACLEDHGHYPNLLKHFRKYHKDKAKYWEQRKYRPSPNLKLRLQQLKIQQKTEWKLKQIADGESDSIRRNRSSRYFFRVSANLLLCRCTLVSHSGNQLTCQEPHCDKTFGGCDFTAFKAMLDHIDETHMPLYPSDTTERTCPLCEKEIKSALDLRYHLKTHHELKRVVCECCMSEYEITTSLNYHYTLVHPEEDSIWEEWRKLKTKDSEKKKNYSTSKKTNATAEKIIKSKTTPIKDEDKDPAKVKFNPNRLHRPGGQSDRNFYAIGETLMLHKFYLVSRSPSHFSCQEKGCEFTVNGTDYFNAFDELRMHYSECHAPLDIPKGSDEVKSCPMCETTFKKSVLLRAHILIKHRPRVICPSCSRLISHGSIEGHGWLHKNEEERAAILAAGGVDPTEVQRERRMVVPVNPAICPDCGKCFRTKALLRQHAPTHLPLSLRESFKCPEENCNAILKSKPSLQNHIERLHRPELATRVRVCRICNKRFNFRDGDRYRCHMRSHTRETPWVCELCGKGFRSRRDLQRHAHVHLTERSYQCEYCLMTYKYPNNLKRHRLTAHKDLVPPGTLSEEQKIKTMPWNEYHPHFIGPKRMYPCDLCERVYPLRSRMTKHAKICPKRIPNADKPEETEEEEEVYESEPIDERAELNNSGTKSFLELILPN